MVKMKFVLMLLALTLIGFGGWGYTAYQHNVLISQIQIIENNNAGNAEEFEKLLAENKRLTALVEADINERKAREEKAEANFKRMNKNPYRPVTMEDLKGHSMGMGLDLVK
jgi:hypothetical protein